MRQRKPLIGQQYGHWLIIAEAPDKLYENKHTNYDSNRMVHHRIVVARCRCGTTRSVHAANLITGNSKSCGCMKSQIQREKMKQFWAKAKK